MMDVGIKSSVIDILGGARTGILRQRIVERKQKTSSFY